MGRVRRGRGPERTRARAARQAGDRTPYPVAEGTRGRRRPGLPRVALAASACVAILLGVLHGARGPGGGGGGVVYRTPTVVAELAREPATAPRGEVVSLSAAPSLALAG